MRCPECQSETPRDSSGHCPRCGRRIAADEESATADFPASSQEGGLEIAATIDHGEGVAVRNVDECRPVDPGDDAAGDAETMATMISAEFPEAHEESTPMTAAGKSSSERPSVSAELAATMDPTAGSLHGPLDDGLSETLDPTFDPAASFPVTIDPPAATAEPRSRGGSGTVDVSIASDLASADEPPVTMDDARRGPPRDENETAQTLVSEDFDDSFSGGDPGGTMAADRDGPDERNTRTIMSEDLESAGTVQLTDDAQAARAGNLEAALRTIQSNFDDSQRNDDPRMTIKSRGKESVLESGLLGETLVMVPKRTMRPQSPPGKPSGAAPADDYELLKVLGEGGMGVVWSARQTSVDRTVAVKMIRGPQAEKRSQRQKFLAEAIVTGDLDHPNIVPIYDVGADRTGALFYAMKQVKGTPWLKVLNGKSLHENLEILLRVADAVAFAHSRGIIHRDLKPENVMLGEYGEVLVMDWGLALATGDFEKAKILRRTTSMGGTPAYMAPEMATGPIDLITPLSDVYLLGAVLWELVTGRPPHPGKKVQECLLAAVRNEIRPTDKSGELIAVARKAMSADPRARHRSVTEFQQAIRDYLSHSESVTLATRADQDLTKAAVSGEYRDFSKAVFGFEEAFELWDGNAAAKAGVVRAKHAYASAALAKGDYDLGSSLLSQDEPEHLELLQRLRGAIAEREARQQRLRVAKRVMTAMAVGLFLVVSTALVWIRSERNYALEQQAIAVDEAEKAQAARRLEEAARIDADSQRKLAEAKRLEAEAAREREATQRQKAEQATAAALAARRQEEEQRRKAETATQQALAAQQEEAAQRKKAEQATMAAVAARMQEERAKEEALDAQAKEAEQRLLAERAREEEKYKAYIAGIGLAAAKIDENAFDVAAELLEQCPVELRHWEWGRLKHLCDQSSWTLPAQGPVDGVALSPDGSQAAVASWDGTARIWNAVTGEEIRDLPYDGLYVHSVAWHPDGSLLAISGNDPQSRSLLVNPNDGRVIARFSGHDDAVVKVRFSPDGRCLLTCSYDQTAKLWDVTDPTTPKVLSILDGHSWWVWDAAFSPDFRLDDPQARNRIVTVSQDGRAIVWSPPATASSADSLTAAAAPARDRLVAFRQQAVFTGHTGPVYAVVWLPSGDEVATGGYDKRILLWNPDGIPEASPDSILEDAPQSVRFRELVGHTGPVQALTVTRDGGLLVSGGRDNAVKAWETATGKPIQTFRGHSSGVKSVAVTPDGRRIFSGGQDQRAIAWSVRDYAEIRVLGGRRFAGHTDAVLSAAFSPDGTSILTAGRDRTARLWDGRTGALTRTFEEGHDYLASRGVIFDEGRILATAAADGTVRLWSVAAGAQILKLDGTGPAAPLAFSPDERRLVTGGIGHEAKLWEIPELLERSRSSPETSEESVALEPRLLTGHNGLVTAAAFSPTTGGLLTCDANGRCILRTVESDKPLWNVQHHTRRITACAFTPDGSQILTASLDHTVGRIDALTGEEIPQRILGHETAVTAMALSRDGRRVMTVAAIPGAESHLAARLTLWETDSARELSVVDVEGFGINGVEFPPDGRSVLAVGTDNTVRQIPLSESGRHSATGTIRLDFRQLGGLVWSATFSDDGASLLTVGGSEARLWDAATGRERMSFSPHGAVAAAEFSPDGRQLATGSWDHSVKIWNVATGQAEFKLDKGHAGFVNSVQYSADGRFLLTAADDGTAKLWSLQDRQVVREFLGHQGRVRQAVFSADGARVLTVGGDRTARVWDTATGKPIGDPLTGHRWTVLCGRFSPDGTRILTGSEDQTAILRDAATGKLIATLQGHTAAVAAVAFSTDGRRIFTAGRDNTAKLWDATPGHEGQEILTLQGHGEDLTSIAVSPDGRQVLTGSRDGTAVLWPTSRWREEN